MRPRKEWFFLIWQYHNCKNIVKFRVKNLIVKALYKIYSNNDSPGLVEVIIVKFLLRNPYKKITLIVNAKMRQSA